MEKALDLMSFIDNSPSVFHVQKNIEKILLKNSFVELNSKEKWNIKKDGKYFIKRNNNAIIAFVVGEEDLEKQGFRLVGSHIDSPSIKIKPNPEIESENNYIKFNTEVYGSPILSTWFDRPLSLAGKLVLKGDNILNPNIKLIDFEKPVFTIPNLAIHFNRELNNGHKIDKQNELLPLSSFVDQSLKRNDYLYKSIKDKYNISKEEILDFELFLYEANKGTLFGFENEFFSIGKLDDLWMVYSSLSGFISSEKSKSTKVAVFLDNEEVGSATAEGAESNYLLNALKRISFLMEKNIEEFDMALNNSIMVSADLAHATHPNYPSKNDLTNRPALGKGPVLKYSSNKRYSTDSFSGAIFVSVCNKNNISYQKYVNNSNIAGGTTMGPTFSLNLVMPVIDMGAAILSMHSIREVGAVRDIESTEMFFKNFFEI